MRLSARRISLLVICAVCIFGAVGCNKKTAVRTGARIAEKQVRPRAKTIWKEARGQLAEEGVKNGGEVWKFSQKKLNERNKDSTPQTIDPFPIPKRNFVPPTKKQEEFLKNYKFPSNNFNQQLKLPTTSHT